MASCLTKYSAGATPSNSWVVCCRLVSAFEGCLSTSRWTFWDSAESNPPTTQVASKTTRDSPQHRLVCRLSRRCSLAIQPWISPDGMDTETESRINRSTGRPAISSSPGNSFVMSFYSLLVLIPASRIRRQWIGFQIAVSKWIFGSELLRWLVASPAIYQSLQMLASKKFSARLSLDSHLKPESTIQ